MKRTLKMAQEELATMNLYLEDVPKWYRDSSLKGTKQFYVKGCGVTRWTGDDGESNYSPRVCVRIAVKSVSDITIDMIKSEYAKTHQGKNIDEAIKVALVEQKKEDERIAIVRAEYEAKRIAKAEKASIKATEETVEERKKMVIDRFDSACFDDKKPLCFFADIHRGCLMADHYRQEFTRLIQHTGVLQMALDICTLQFPDFNEMMLRINARANALGIEHESLGGVTSAIKYLCQDIAKESEEL